MSDAGIQRGRDPRGKGGGGEKGLAAGGSAPPARPLWTRHCLLKGHSGIQIPRRLEEGASRAGAGGCETGTPRTDVLATSSGGGNYLRCP